MPPREFLRIGQAHRLAGARLQGCGQRNDQLILVGYLEVAGVLAHRGYMRSCRIDASFNLEEALVDLQDGTESVTATVRSANPRWFPAGINFYLRADTNLTSKKPALNGLPLFDGTSYVVGGGHDLLCW